MSTRPPVGSDAINAAKMDLAHAITEWREAEKKAEACEAEVSRRQGLVAVAIAKAIERGADPALVLPLDMCRAHRITPRIITSAAALEVQRIANSIMVEGSRFPGWMLITIGEIRAHYMPAPLWEEWDKAREARKARREAGK